MVVDVPDLRFPPGIIRITGVIHVTFVNLTRGEPSEGPRMRLNKLLKKLQFDSKYIYEFKTVTRLRINKPLYNTSYIGISIM